MEILEKISAEQQSAASITSNVGGRCIGWSSAMIFQDHNSSTSQSDVPSNMSFEDDVHKSKKNY